MSETTEHTPVAPLYPGYSVMTEQGACFIPQALEAKGGEAINAYVKAFVAGMIRPALAPTPVEDIHEGE
jgi:hypothetical protein